MKFKNILCIIGFFIISALDARTFGTRPTTQPTVIEKPYTGGTEEIPAKPMTKPAQVAARPLKYYFDNIRSKNPANIFANGQFLPGFIQDIKSFNLTPELQTILLRAAINIHLPLPTDNKEALQVITNAKQQIPSIVGGKPVGEKPLSIIMPTETPTFTTKDIIAEIVKAIKSKGQPTYTTSGVDPNWLIDVLANLKMTVLDRNTADIVVSTIVENIRPSLDLYAYLDRNILRQQIKDTITQLSNFYNPVTNLLNEEYLRYRVMGLANNLSLAEKKRKLTSELMPKMREQWDNEGAMFTDSYKKNLATQLTNQIDNAIRQYKIQRLPGTQGKESGRGIMPVEKPHRFLPKEAVGKRKTD